MIWCAPATQLVNRLHVLLVKLVPTGLAAELAAEALRRARPRTTLGRTLRAWLWIWLPSCAPPGSPHRRC